MSHQHMAESIIIIIIFFFFGVVLGLELKTFTLSHAASPFFVVGFFELGSHELFAWAGFKP
jgi:hypothetical protein